jgi:hypothetical protein
MLVDGWRLTVISTNFDAWNIIQAENRFNDPPAPGGQFVMVTISATNVSAKSTSFDGSYRLRSVGAASVPYKTFTNSCGVIPNSFLFAGDEAFQGGTIVRNVCWGVSKNDVGSLLLYDDGVASVTPGPFFALR